MLLYGRIDVCVFVFVWMRPIFQKQKTDTAQMYLSDTERFNGEQFALSLMASIEVK